jgi:hypothetical protein
MYKAMCALIALVMLVLFFGPVSAAAPSDVRMAQNVIIVAPACDKREEEDDAACFDRYCTAISPGPGPPADLSATYSQENIYCQTQGVDQTANINEQNTLQSTGPPKEYRPKPISSIRRHTLSPLLASISLIGLVLRRTQP